MRKRIVKASRNARTARKVSRMTALKASKNIRARKRRVMASMSQDELEDEIRSCIDNMDASDLVWLWNEYCDNNRYTDDKIYMMSDFDELESGSTPLEIARLIEGNDFRTGDDYFAYTTYGAESFSSPEDFKSFDADDLTRYIVRNEDSLGNDEIQEILDSAEDDEDEE